MLETFPPAQKRLSWTYRDLPPRLLLCIHDLSVIDNHRVPRGSLTQIPADGLAELGLRITQEQDVVAFNAVRFAPRTHDPRVIERQHGHDVDSLPLDALQVLNVTRKM